MSKNPLGSPQPIPPRYTGARTRIGSIGYVFEHCPLHPSCNRFGYLLQHRLVMEEHLGRYLTGLEVVHHEDGDKENNAIQNLRLFPSQAHHIRYHQVKSAKRYNPDVIAMVRAAATDPNMSQKDLGMSPMTVLAICREQGIEWKKPPAPYLDEDRVREALRGRSTLEAAEILGCNHNTLRNHWGHLLVKRKSPTPRKRS